MTAQTIAIIINSVGLLITIILFVISIIKFSAKVGKVMGIIEEQITMLNENYDKIAKHIEVLNHELGNIRDKLTEVYTDIKWLKQYNKGE